MNEIEIIQKAKHGDKYAFGLQVQKFKRQAYFSRLPLLLLTKMHWMFRNRHLYVRIVHSTDLM